MRNAGAIEMHWGFSQFACMVAFSALLLSAPSSIAQQQSAAPSERGSPAAQEAAREVTQPLNNAPVWREVRSGVPAITAVTGQETNVLIQPTMKLPFEPAVSAGEAWRLARPPLSTIGGTIIALSVLALFAFFRWRGSIGVHEPPTGRFIERFSNTDRMVHWTVAISFSVLAITGLIMGLGKYLVIPLIGHTAFSWLAIVSKTTHNFVGPIFTVFLPVLIAIFIRDNLPKMYDLQWLKTFGGMLSKNGGEVPSGRFNAGEKGLFWILPCFFGVLLVVSGLILDFPNFGQLRMVMQQANLVHMVAALLAIAVACFHIYLGTVGQRGAYQAMRTGYVDEAWAKEHHRIWYEDVKTGRSRQRFAHDVPPQTRAHVLEALEEH
ncbi:MAG: fdhC [Betaproteobacteria bacterium]|nr:fdhC [Betaproteobacteria bacterium]